MRLSILHESRRLLRENRDEDSAVDLLKTSVSLIGDLVGDCECHNNLASQYERAVDKLSNSDDFELSEMERTYSKRFEEFVESYYDHDGESQLLDNLRRLKHHLDGFAKDYFGYRAVKSGDERGYYKRFSNNPEPFSVLINDLAELASCAADSLKFGACKC